MCTVILILKNLQVVGLT